MLVEKVVVAFSQLGLLRAFDCPFVLSVSVLTLHSYLLGHLPLLVFHASENMEKQV